MTNIQTPSALDALKKALEIGRIYEGATSPNPPVGAAAMNREGKIISLQAHTQAGTPHAEAKVIQDLRDRGLLSEVHTLVITLEPCNHMGRTPPCTEVILSAQIPRVLYGTSDPNPKVAGRGAERLRDAGIEVAECEGPLNEDCIELIAAFSHWAKTGMPYVIVKTAHRKGTSGQITPQSMVPPSGHKTFTSQTSLQFAHQLRKRADAILTGSGTVLTDLPQFTVRQVKDHELVKTGQKPRILVIFDRKKRVPESYLRAAQQRGFEVWIRTDIKDTLRELGQRGALTTLVEAGPELTQSILSSGFWNKHVVITEGNPDKIECLLGSFNNSAK